MPQPTVGDWPGSRILGVLLAAAMLAACGELAAAPLGRDVERRDYDVLAEVVDAELEPGSTTSERLAMWSGRPDTAGHVVGPLTLVLADERRLEVPAGTPGGNACLVLLDDAGRRAITGLDGEDGVSDEAVMLYGMRTPHCVLAIDLAADGTVARYEVLGIADPTDLPVPAGLGFVDGRLVDVGAVVEVLDDGRLLTSSGFAFSVDDRVRVFCPGDLATVDEVLASRPASTVVVVDSSTERVVAVSCLYAD